jgi:multidrug efflux pump subunit AcrB
MSAKRVKNQIQETGDKMVFIKDIAEVKESLRDRKKYSRYNGNENVSVGIYQQSGSNLINLSKEAQKKLKDIKTKIPEDIDIKITSDQSDFIKESLANLYSNGIQGILFSFILLYFLMKSFMASTIINIAIPVALCITLSLIYFGDISLNTVLIPKAFMPKVDERRFVLNVKMPPDTPLEITNATSKRVEKLISGCEEIRDLSVSVCSTG